MQEIAEGGGGGGGGTQSNYPRARHEGAQETQNYSSIHS